jgi:hypothetical protein
MNIASLPWLLRIVVIFCLVGQPALRAQPGQTTFGEQKYVEYTEGDLPLVISSPHGGRAKPDEIPTREQGVVQIDTNTQEVARAVVDEFRARTGRRPHLVVCQLHRQKLDVNREIQEAAAGNATAEKAWKEYHGFVEQALKAAVKQSGKAFYIDLHGQAHPDHRIELGYLHDASLYGKPDAVLNGEATVAASSLRKLVAASKLSYVELIRGPRSLGGMLEARGFACTPSPERPVPNVPYFRGGYSVRRHAFNDAPVAGLQIEMNFEGVRDTPANRGKFATTLVEVLREFLAREYGMKLGAS